MVRPTTRSHKLFADAIASVHFLWTLFLATGAVLMLLYPPYATVQIIVMSFTLLLSLPFGRTCPLTLIEEKLRQKIDPDYRNHGSFVTTYTNKIFKTDFTPMQVHVANGILYFLAYAAAISLLIWH